MGKALLYRALGLILYAGGTFMGLAAVLGSTVVGPAAISVLILGGLCALLGRASFNRGRRFSMPSAEEVRRRDRRSPVIYLRSFADDATTARPLNVDSGGPHGSSYMTFATEEQQLVKVLGEIGPVIALGRPGEKLPALGAARKQVSDREWKTVVRNDMDEARLVVLRVGDGGRDAYWWEVEQAGLLPPEKVLFIVPDDERLYDAFREKAQKTLTRLRGALPAYAGNANPFGRVSGFMYFESDWTPRFLALKNAPLRGSAWSPLVPLIKTSLQPVFERLGVQWSRPSLNVGYVAIAAIGIGLMMVMVVFLLGAAPLGLPFALIPGAVAIHLLRLVFREMRQ